MAQLNQKRPVLSTKNNHILPGNIPQDGTAQKNNVPVQLMQNQLDELIGRAYARGVRKGKRDAAETVAEELEKKAREVLRAATGRLLHATVREAAASLGLSAKGAQTALRLMDFSGCIKDGDVNETAVKELVAGFLEEYPEFYTRPQTAGRKASRRRRRAFVTGGSACKKQAAHTTQKGRRPSRARQIRQAAFSAGDGAAAGKEHNKERHP